jgi:hypothetical protein
MPRKRDRVAGNGALDAFGLLMNPRNSKKPSAASSRFVVCPAGCGKHVPSSNVNLHLDKCIRAQNICEKEGSYIGREDTVNKVEAVSVEIGKPSHPMETAALTEQTSTSTHSLPRNTIEEDQEIATNKTDSVNSAFLPKMVPAEIAGRSPQRIENKTIVKPTTTEDTPSNYPAPDNGDEAFATKFGTQQTSEEDQTEHRTYQVTPDSAERPPQPKTKVPNVFSHMMNSSKATFSRPKPTKQVLHLSQDGSISLLFDTSDSPGPVAWSAIVLVKTRTSHDEDALTSSPEHPKIVQVTLSTAIPSYPDIEPSHRWVRRHSRLSVPVLKSILQKAVRRRKPLPAVKVAMELIDKSLGELLRRLPIIAIEDSTLHPALPLLVWLMMAHSKDYVLNPQLCRQVLQIVFEIAGCPYKDPLPYSTEGDTVHSRISLSSLDSGDDVLIWALLARAEYGGMKGDVLMLQQYANAWRQRMGEVSSTAPTTLVQQLHLPKPHVPVTWQNVPHIVHESAHKQALERIGLLGIEMLEISDLTLEGVDFHCSNILDELANDCHLVNVCHDLLLLSSSGEKMPAGMVDFRSWLVGFWKSCMWMYSAGVNRRRNLVTLVQPDNQGDKAVPSGSAMWNELLAPRVQEFQQNYLQQRLVRKHELDTK